ncbi:SRPBCC family protein [Saccharopolyspora taberi]|uniref:Dimethyladenosine transferase n=1 Tax=Saccharopolyspora taberi TaxID=60895 RepID=A0ABN3VGK7_9PSEU
MANSEHFVSSSVIVAATPEAIFEILSDPRKHPLIDGSGTVREGISGPDRLVLGSKFGMRMKIGLGYRIRNTVVEFEPNRLIAWKHFSPHRWRYRLEPVEGGTRVTETFDYSRMPLPAIIGRSPMATNNLRAIKNTLHRLKSHVEGGE